MSERTDAESRAIGRKASISAAFLAALFAGAHASAQDYPVRNVGGWSVGASADKNGCFLTRTFEGPGATTLFFGLDIDGSNRLSLLNGNWSIKDGERRALTFRLSNGGYSDQPVVGMASDGKRGFVTTFEPKFASYLAASKALAIYRGEVPVAKLTLDGSGAAVAELRRCVDMFRTKPSSGKAERNRADGVPIDPFAPDVERKPRK